jgi:hypothetical protein
VIKIKKRVQVGKRLGVVIAAGAAHQIGEQDAGADRELGDDDVRYAHQGDEHGRRQIGHVPDGKFHHVTHFKVINRRINHNDEARSS